MMSSLLIMIVQWSFVVLVVSLSKFNFTSKTETSFPFFNSGSVNINDVSWNLDNKYPMMVKNLKFQVPKLGLNKGICMFMITLMIMILI